MGYISLEPVTIQKLVCNHPKIKKIWEYGGSSRILNNDFRRFLHLQLDNDSIETFEDGGEGKAIEDAEKFLSELK